MGKPTFWQKVRELIGKIAWRIYLWSEKMTQELYEEQMEWVYGSGKSAEEEAEWYEELLKR